MSDLHVAVAVTPAQAGVQGRVKNGNNSHAALDARLRGHDDAGIAPKAEQE